jgi:hypothetical protein
MIKKIRISVTAKDIAAGARNDCTACPIALAMRRAGLSEPWARPGNLFWERDRSAETPDVAADFMKRFDDGEPVKPFRFTITAWVE